MGRSLGLAAYRAFVRRMSPRGFSPHAVRPKGTIVWIHAAEPGSLLAVQDLSQRLCAARADIGILITLPDTVGFDMVLKNWVPYPNMFLELIPSEHPDAIKAFWRHWAPDMLIWTWGDLRPNLIAKARDKGCPLALIDADETGFDASWDRWLPELSRQLLDACVAVMARSEQASAKLQSLGIDRARITVTQRLEAGGHALPCDDRDLADWSQLLAARSVWLACNVQSEEVQTVIDAHLRALRFSHRLLLVLHPAGTHLMAELREMLSARDIRFADWSEEEEPDDATQVLLAPDHRELGLFYRLAPVSFMGSSLVSGYDGRNPFEAAALGSAVLYGPKASRYMPFFARLARAGAARIVNDTDTLSAAVTRLIAPDQAAQMAHAGWDVVSQGADLTDRVIDLVHRVLDGELEAVNAGP
ncbi:MAG: glycosyltransferase N-terminal domain-containing protein [Pseudomonadota bacterium]